MENVSKNLSIIAFYLSEYDILAVKELGFSNRSEAFKAISILMGRDNNYLKLRRDEFDVLTNSTRNGWKNRPVAPDVQKMYEELISLPFEEITKKVKGILDVAKIEIEVQTEINVEEQRYAAKVQRYVSSNLGKKHLENNPQKKKEQRQYNSVKYPRDTQKAANAICNAQYKCEVNEAHETFIRKANGKPYTEPHHIVPMCAQRDFSVSLDVENNIVSLCSHCHNLLHYGENFEHLLKQIYTERKELLKRVGIDIDFESLLKYYK